jgi:two-component system, OmpR family, sensor histidine kinase QseC
VRSIRRFLVITLLSVATLLNFAAALRGYHRGMAEAETLFNARMRQHLELLDHGLPEPHPRDAAAGGGRRPAAPGLADAARLEFQWLTPDARLLARSAGMPATPVAALEEGFTFANFGGYRWHVLAAPSSDRRSWFVLAERDDQRWRMAESVILPAVLPMVLAVPLLGVLIWSLLGVGLKPVATLARDLGRREASDLSPLSTRTLPTELQPLAESANSLLRRLEASFERERRFSADAAHELRTPLAALRIQCENFASAHPGTDETASKLQAGIERLEHLVEQILVLNRVAPDQYMGRFEEVPLCRLARQVVAEQSAALAAKGHEIELTGGEAVVRGDAAALSSMLGNLLGNAIKFTPAGGHVRIDVEQAGDAVRLDVCDDGIGIEPAQRERVFDRFYRLDGDASAASMPGSGLGLSIVRQVAELHGARIELLESPFGRGLRVRVLFPRAGCVR